jgi:hypothetical protein
MSPIRPPSGAKETSAGDRRTTAIYEYTSSHSGSAQPGTSTASALIVCPIESEQGIPDLVPALKLFKGFSFSVLWRANLIRPVTPA